MEITITPKQFMELKRIPMSFPVDTGDEAMDLRNLPLHLEAFCDVIGRQIVSDALATGEEVKVTVDWNNRKTE